MIWIDRGEILNKERDDEAEIGILDTYWRIIRLYEMDVITIEARGEPYIIFREANGQKTCSASIGCNQMRGGFIMDGDELSIGPIAGTRMACPPPLDVLEQYLLKALAMARRWKLDGKSLFLFDETGTSIAKLEANEKNASGP